MVKLIVQSGGSEREYPIGEGLTIGRHPSNSVQIDEQTVSKRHARIECVDGRYLLRDLESTNGTYVEGRRVEEYPLAHGDEIRVGGARLLFVSDANGGANLPLKSVILTSDLQEQISDRRYETGAVEDFPPEREVREEDVLRGDYERLRIAYELSLAIGSELELDSLLHKIIRRAFDILPADRGVILVMDEEGRPVPRVAEQREGGKVEDIVISSSIIREVTEGRKGILCSDVTADQRFAEAKSIVAHDIRSTMVVPLVHADQVFGIMHLDTRQAVNAFSEKDLKIFASIASQAAVAVHNAQLAARNEWEAQTRTRLQRFFSPEMVQQLVEGNLKLEGGGEMRDVTCLFSDIRGFTAMTERSDAPTIMELLNSYFEEMVDVIFRHNGTLDKYVGDEIMALFGVPVERGEPAVDAVACALEMMEVLEAWNARRTSQGHPRVDIGIGINTGPCVYGALGSSKTLQYTAIGDPVNTASRLCSVAKAGQVILSQNTFQKTSHRILAEPLPPVRVKGKEEALQIYRVERMQKADGGDNTSPSVGD